MPKAMKKRHRVEMYLGESGNLELATGESRCNASEFAIHALPGDEIAFHCAHGRFGIHFPVDTPFEHKQYFSDPGEPIVAGVRLDAKPGRYKHDVSVVVGEAPTYWDPDIVIDT